MEIQRKPVPDVEALRYHGTPGEPDIKIFVSHRIDQDSEAIDNPLYIPVRCGAVYDERENVEMLGDDTGDNISEKRNSFCELTVQYWAWKNIKADYYGFCHYRRYHCFADGEFTLATEEANNGCIVVDRLSDDVCQTYGLEESVIRELLAENDVICHRPIDLRNHNLKNNYAAMKASPKYHIMKDVDEVLRIISKKYPSMYKYARRYFSGQESWLYNCYVMKAEVFEEYAQWLFDVLFELEKTIEDKEYTITQYRAPAGVAERLWGVYLLYLRDQGKYKIKEVPLIFISDTTKQITLKPISSNEITLASNFNNNYVDVFCVFLESVLGHADPDVIYDYIILSDDITPDNKALIEKMVLAHPNFYVRFYAPRKHLEGVSLFVNNSVYTKEMYYRTIIPFALSNFKKALVLDVDAICCRDVKELFETDITNYYAAAVKDVVFQGWLNGYVFDAKDYAKNTLKLKKPYDYCNTGVLLMNLEKIRSEFTEEYIQQYIDEHQFRVFEQDTLNVLFQGNILYLDAAWNCFTYTNTGVQESIAISTHTDAQAYLSARKNPYIIHYAAHPKPWTIPSSDFAQEFWKYAKMSPAYERLIFRLITDNASNIPVVQQPMPVAEPGQTRFRDFVDIFFPKGSRRRNVLKKILPRPNTKTWNFFRAIKNKIAAVLKL